MNLYDRVLAIVEKAHEGQKDKGGNDYIEHVKIVANLVDTESEKAVALLHDIVEDTETTLEDLMAAGIPNEVVEAVAVITKQRSEP